MNWRKSAQSGQDGRKIGEPLVFEVRRSTASGWSEAALKAAGAFSDFPSVEELRQCYGPESPREPFD